MSFLESSTKASNTLFYKEYFGNELPLKVDLFFEKFKKKVIKNSAYRNLGWICVICLDRAPFLKHSSAAQPQHIQPSNSP